MKDKYGIFNKVSNSELNKLFTEWVKNEKARKLLRRHFIDGITFERLAEEMGMSTQWVKQIVYRYADIVAEIIRKTV